MEDLDRVTDNDPRVEARRRGFELHSVQFSQAAQNALRELGGCAGESTSWSRVFRRKTVPGINSCNNEGADTSATVNVNREPSA
jgi:hypothetical protein